jgi:hypothetical protein
MVPFPKEEELQDEKKAEVVEQTEEKTVLRIPGRRRTLKSFMDNIKDGLIDLFREEEDRQL